MSASAADRVERRGPGGALAMPCAYHAELTQLDGAGDDGGNAVGLDEGKPDLTSATI
jgi:hypothetical protein